MRLLHTLREAMRTGVAVVPADSSATPDADGAAARLLRAMASGARPGPDLAVLLRQVVRRNGRPLLLPGLKTAWDEWLGFAGLRREPGDEVAADPCVPEDLDAPPVPARPDERVPAEEHVRRLGFTVWNSAAQKEAAWRVSQAGRGSTSLVVLPTGAGKSLVGQLLAAEGTGLTVVVVPTVALAIDQCRAAEAIPNVGDELRPRYYASGEDADAVLADVESGKTRLVFTSPEACVSGRLRPVLAKLAAADKFDALVIDEAHVVETWGAFFRVDFQLLSAARREWLDRGNGRLRTLLLSATLTPDANRKLRDLFPPTAGAAWADLVCLRLRPEMRYFARWFGADAAGRDAAVLEELGRLPRPAILYTTERKEAVRFHDLLCGQGYVRLGCFHGDTKATDRRALMRRWRDDEIDLMVATSAFGLGVDKADVRAVVHACYPEDLNRYYQEVGRGGRDGRSSACLLLPTERDRRVAEGLRPKLMDADKIAKRWSAMWQAARQVDGDYRFRLDIGSIREGRLGERAGDENRRWNERLLLQLHRAKKIRLVGQHFERNEENDDGREFVEAEILEGFSPGRDDISATVMEHREEEVEASRESFGLVGDFVHGRECIGNILAGMFRGGRVCSGCPHCRATGEPPTGCPPLRWASPAEYPPRPTLVGECPAGGAELRDLLRECLAMNIRRFVVPPGRGDAVRDALAALRQAGAHRVDEGGSTLLPGETAAVLHFGDDFADAVGGGGRVHFVAPPADANRLRYAYEARGARAEYFASWRSWERSRRGS